MFKKNHQLYQAKPISTQISCAYKAKPISTQISWACAQLVFFLSSFFLVLNLLYPKQDSIKHTSDQPSLMKFQI